MGYEDFVWFILSEEDKANDLSLEYWFKCVDLDCDGCLRPNEMLVRPACRADSACLLCWASCLGHSWQRRAASTCSRRCSNGDPAGTAQCGVARCIWTYIAAALGVRVHVTYCACKHCLNLAPLALLQYFYEEQLHRMDCLSQEPVLFEDVLCQMHDMIQPGQVVHGWAAWDALLW